MLLYALTIFLSAFLLFQVEPIIAKIILPWFGGSSAVWTTCLVFFQLSLLLGYFYAYTSVKYLRPKLQARVHMLLLALSGLTLPILPGNAWKLTGPQDPTFHILLLLAATVGLPFLLLSATTPLLQAWYAIERPGLLPYRLFALSNTGSMLALLSYPFIIEPLVSTRHQATIWSAAYALAAVLCAAAAMRVRTEASSGDQIEIQAGPGSHPEPATELRINSFSARAPGDGSRTGHDGGEIRRYGSSRLAPSRRMQLLWVAFAACASALLLAITNHLSQNVAAVPFLWVLPLSLYLLSFILCFEGRGWYRRDLFMKLCGVALGSMAYALSPEFANSSLYLLVPLFSAGLFVCCMVCHGELERLKPHPQHLTSFYLMIALGGATGGLFVGLAAPHIFSGYFELPVAMSACGVLALVALRRDASGTFYEAHWKPVWLTLVGLCAALAVYLALQSRAEASEVRVRARNFYGSLRVIETDEPDLEDEMRKLMNGTIQHGSQFLEAKRRRLPTTYYGPQSGVGVALREAGRRGSIRVGVIGLGVGTIAAYGRPGDNYIFYEINPLVITFAKTQFTFLRDSAAKVDVVQGDARLSLEQEPAQNFNVLAVDAFTSDSIPVHLLTREAFLLYFRHLKPGGILALHVSNRYLDLRPVVQGAAESLGKATTIVESKKDEDNGIFVATWVLASDDRGFLQSRELQMALSPLESVRKPQMWTDDYSNLFRILK